VKKTILMLVAALCTAAPIYAQEIVPYKLGVFEQQGRNFVGIVLGEEIAIDLAAANAAVPSSGGAVTAPVDMNDLITRYESGLRSRIVEIVRHVSQLPAGSRPSWVHSVSALRIRPPVAPLTMMNAAVNYADHDIEMAAVRDGAPGQSAPTGGLALPGTTSAPGIWERSATDQRWNPFIFLKAPASIIAHGEAIRIPPQRDRIEWECELAVVIGRTASHVPAGRALDHIFGYTLQNDISDRGGRGDTRYGSDWLVTKSHDTFAPMGPFITPKEFLPDMRRVALSFSLNGEVLQEGTTAQMIHSIEELVSYGSNILTLRPGDVVATGTPPGSGSARTPPVFLKAGDLSVCSYEGVGTLVNPVEGPITR